MDTKGISVFGLGYVGSVTAAVLAAEGHRVVGVDKDILKIRSLREGKAPVSEPGLEEMIEKALAKGNLRLTQDQAEAVAETNVSLVCVGTPSGLDGAPDLRDLVRVAEAVAVALADKTEKHAVLIRSTVLPGTTRGIIAPVFARLAGKKLGEDLLLGFHPEFLREASALEDFYRPSRVVVGWVGEGDDDLVRSIYSFIAPDIPFFFVSAEDAECVKYADNAFHGLKVAFANEIARLARSSGGDPSVVAEMFLSDKLLNISPLYLRPGFAFGGSCLPKDIRALEHRARTKGIPAPVISSVLISNQEHIRWIADRIASGGPETLGIYGLSFKEFTDDLRESPALYLMRELGQRGVDLRVTDPDVLPAQLHGRNLHEALEIVPWLLEVMATPQEVFASEAVVFLKRPRGKIPRGLKGFDLTGKIQEPGIEALP